MREDTLTSYSDVYTATAGAGGVTVHALAGNDVIRVAGTVHGDDNAVVFDAGDGDDLMYGGAGANTFIGGAGNDRAFLPEAIYGYHGLAPRPTGRCS